MKKGTLKKVMRFSDKYDYLIKFYEEKAELKVYKNIVSSTEEDTFDVGVFFPQENKWVCKNACILRPDVKLEVEGFYNLCPSA